MDIGNIKLHIHGPRTFKRLIDIRKNTPFSFSTLSYQSTLFSATTKYTFRTSIRYHNNLPCTIAQSQPSANHNMANESQTLPNGVKKRMIPEHSKAQQHGVLKGILLFFSLLCLFFSVSLSYMAQQNSLLLCNYNVVVIEPEMCSFMPTLCNALLTCSFACRCVRSVVWRPMLEKDSRARMFAAVLRY